MLCRAKASSVSQVGLDAATNSVLFFLIGGVSFCSGVDAPEVLDSEPKVTPPSLVYTPSDLTSNKAFRITFPLGGGFTGQGGGIFNAGTLTVVNSRLSGNAADDQGGGIFNLGTLILNKSIIADNTAIVGGGVYNCIEGQIADDIISSPCHGTLTLQRTTVTENTPDNIFP